MTARELFDNRARGEDGCMADSPHAREEGQSWRYVEDEHCESPMSSFASVNFEEEPQTNAIGVGCMVCCVLCCPFLVTLGIAWVFSCWLVSLPGIVWLCVPLCLWAAWEIHKLWLYWDGRVQFIEEWPALKLLRTSVIALVFAVTLCMNLVVAVIGIRGIELWSVSKECPF